MNRRNFLASIAAAFPVAGLASTASLFQAAASGEKGAVRVNSGARFKANHRNLPQTIVLPTELCTSPSWRAAFLCAAMDRMEEDDISVARQEKIADEIDKAMRAGSDTEIQVATMFLSEPENEGTSYWAKMELVQWGMVKPEDRQWPIA